VVNQYLTNWRSYFFYRNRAKLQHKYATKSARDKLTFQFVWFDVFVNMLTGGDPRETVSSSLHKDRKSSWGAGLLINIIEAIDDDHGEVANQPGVGEGSINNYELAGLDRIIVIISWGLICLLLWLLLSRLYTFVFS